MRITKSKEIYFLFSIKQDLSYFKDGDYLLPYTNFSTAKDLMHLINYDRYHDYVYVFEATVIKDISMTEENNNHRIAFSRRKQIITEFRLMMELPIDVPNTWNILFEDFNVDYNIYFTSTKDYTLYKIAISRDNVTLLKHFREITDKEFNPHLLTRALNTNKINCFDYLITNYYNWSDDTINKWIPLGYIKSHTTPNNYNNHIISKMPKEIINETNWFEVVKECIGKGNSKLAVYIIDRFSLDVNQEDANLLETAIRYNYFRCTKMLVKKDCLIGNIDEMKKINFRFIGSKKKAREKRERIFGYLNAVQLVGKSVA